MSQPLHLSEPEAKQKMATVEQALADAKTKQKDMENDATDMLSKDWRGDASIKFGHAMENHQTDMQQIVATLEHVVEVARHNMDVTYTHG